MVGTPIVVQLGNSLQLEWWNECLPNFLWLAERKIQMKVNRIARISYRPSLENWRLIFMIFLSTCNNNYKFQKCSIKVNSYLDNLLHVHVGYIKENHFFKEGRISPTCLRRALAFRCLYHAAPTRVHFLKENLWSDLSMFKFILIKNPHVFDSHTHNSHFDLIIVWWTT